MERNKEYDAFGPWIYEIDEEHDVPGIFRNYCNEDDKQLMLIKIPREIERREASPGMDLYDYLIGAYDTHIRILKRTGKKVNERTVYYDNIIAVKDIHALLNGEVILFTENEPFIILYNTVSEDIILKLINIINIKIESYARNIQIGGIPVEYIPGKADSLDILFFNLCNRLQKVNPGNYLAAYQPGMRIKRTRELKHKLKINKLKLSKTAFIINDKELIVLEREITRRKDVINVYAYSYLYVPFQSISGAGLNYFDEEQHLSNMELKLRYHTFSYIFENKNNKMIDLYQKLNEIDNIV